MKKALLILECLVFFILPMLTSILYVAFMELDAKEISRMVYQAPLISLIAIVGLTSPFSRDIESFHIKLKFLWVLVGVFYVLGTLSLVLYSVMRTKGFPENSFIIILIPGMFLIHIAKEIKALKAG